MEIPNFNDEAYNYLPDHFGAIPMMERPRSAQQYLPLPPRNSGAYNDYNSYGNMAARMNRVNDVRNVEDHYYGSEQIRPMAPARQQQHVAGNCGCSQSAELRGELKTIKKMHDMILFMLAALVIYLLFFNKPEQAGIWSPPSAKKDAPQSI